MSSHYLQANWWSHSLVTSGSPDFLSGRKCIFNFQGFQQKIQESYSLCVVALGDVPILEVLCTTLFYVLNAAWAFLFNKNEAIQGRHAYLLQYREMLPQNPQS